ncbi:MAG TPA: glycosyltransferase family 2 protein [Pyrinomonadaceae bacterium]
MFELTALNFIVWAAWVAVLMWLAGAFLTLRGLARQRPLQPAQGGPRLKDDAPLVSVLVPARNEEGRVLSRCIRSILAQDYARFEVIAVNDRSTDGTAAILNAIARADERLRVVDGLETPTGWLGKPYALQQALDQACGEWVLATDADMIFDESAMRTAVALARANDYDALTLVPRIETETFWERVFAPTFGWFMALGMPMERVNDPQRRDAVGVGGFFLIRRAELRRVGEYRAVRAEVAEDLRMAELMKHSGGRLRIEYAPDLASTRMYSGFSEIWEGFTKNFYAGMKFSLLQTFASIALVLSFIVAPPVLAMISAFALAAGASTEWLHLFVPALIVWLIQVFTFGVVNKSFGVPVRYALTVPLGHALFVVILMNSAFRIATGSGVTWKGRKVYERASGIRPAPRTR